MKSINDLFSWLFSNIYSTSRESCYDIETISDKKDYTDDELNYYEKLYTTACCYVTYKTLME